MEATSIKKAMAGRWDTLTQNVDELTENSRALYSQIMGSALDGDQRDLNFSCGYPDSITIKLYKEMYEREGVAKRVVNVMPDESWAMDPVVFETSDPDETEFERVWNELSVQLNIWFSLQRIDVLSGIGRFGVLLLGLDDGEELEKPVEEGGQDRRLLYLRSFDESVVTVKTSETDIKDHRYGQPVMYTMQFQDARSATNTETKSLDVHWTRVIHIADDRQMSEVYGTPRLEDVYNRIIDMRKVLSGSGEMFWKGGFPGYSIEVTPEMAAAGATIDEDATKEMMQDYMNGLQRYLALTGVTVKSLAPQVSDPTAHLDAELKTIAIAKSIPLRILTGSEAAHLASDQDQTTWNKRLSGRQEKYLTPMIIRPFVDRLIGIGVLPEPTEYTVEWPDLNMPTDEDKAKVAVLKSEAMAKYILGGVEMLMPPEIFLENVMGLTKDDVNAVMKVAASFVDGREDDEDEDDQMSTSEE